MLLASLEHQLKEVILYHYGRELWHSRPEQDYEESIEPFIDDLMCLARRHRAAKSDQDIDVIRVDDHENTYCSTIPGEMIGQKIKSIRLKQKMTIDQLADKSRIDSEYLHNVERGEPILRISILENILTSLGVKSTEVLHF